MAQVTDSLLSPPVVSVVGMLCTLLGVGGPGYTKATVEAILHVTANAGKFQVTGDLVRWGTGRHSLTIALAQ